MIVLGNPSSITIIVLTILLIIIFAINIYYSRKAQQRAIELASDGSSSISDPTIILYITNVLGILLTLIILGIMIYLYVKSTSVGEKLISDITKGVKSIPTKIKTYRASTSTENVDL